MRITAPLPYGALYSPQEQAIVAMVHDGLWLVLPMGSSVIGRHPECNFVLHHLSVSRTHCEFMLLPTSLRVEDRGSTHGLRVNGEPTVSAYLSVGDEVYLGDVGLTIQRLPLAELKGIDRVRFSAPVGLSGLPPKAQPSWAKQSTRRNLSGRPGAPTVRVSVS